MVRLLKLVVFLVLIGFVALVGYAYLGDLRPSQGEVIKDIELNAE